MKKSPEFNWERCLTYTLVGQTPIPEPDTMKWARWFETADRILHQDHIGSGLVSTVFIGVDHNHLGVGDPILFETMIFADGGEIADMWRCSTWLEAEEQHQQAVKQWKERTALKNHNGDSDKPRRRK